MLNGPKHCLNLHGIFFVIFSITVKRNQLQKICLVVSETLTLFVNILTADDKYYLSVKARV